MNWMFKASSFNGNISKWDVSNVENMFGLFNDAVFDGDIDGWFVIKVKELSGSFDSSNFNPSWNISNKEDRNKFLIINKELNNKINIKSKNIKI